MKQSNQPMRREAGGLLFGSDRYRAELFDGDPVHGLTVVTFDCWRPSPGLQGPVPLEGFFQRRGIPVVSVRAALNDWYQHPDIEPAIDAIRRATVGRTLVGYGSSMGGFAALNFAADIGVLRTIAVAPQFSIDRAKVPFEPRWAQEAATVTFDRDKIATMPVLTDGLLAYDPKHPQDVEHARRIQGRHALPELHLHGGGHFPLQTLKDLGLLQGFILRAVLGRLDVAEFANQLRSAAHRPRQGSLNTH